MRSLTVWTPYFAVRNADVPAARIQERGATYGGRAGGREGRVVICWPPSP